MNKLFFKWYMKLISYLHPRPPVAPAPLDEKFKVWEHFTPEELKSISKMLGYHAYGSVELNMNDTFAYASAWGVEVDQFDLVAVSELFEKFGPGGVVAWCSIKEEVEEPIRHYPTFKAAKAEILNNRLKYFWMERIKEKRKTNG